MTTRLDILNNFKRSGDSHVGQTLVRLAQLASAMHAVERANTVSHASSDMPAHGRAGSVGFTVGHAPRATDTAHTEVG
ncbi:MAG: hypothetical protein GC164_05315 [Phycisphaera sp.]|nr:hypothetical protein [Phycisphaera sp.]